MKVLFFHVEKSLILVLSIISKQIKRIYNEILNVSGMLTGMNETSATIAVAPQNSTSLVIIEKVVKAANLGVVPSGQDNIHR